MVKIVKKKGTRELPFEPARLTNKLKHLAFGVEPVLKLDKKQLKELIESSVVQIKGKDEITVRELETIVIKNGLDYITSFKKEDGSVDFGAIGNIDFDKLSARILLNSLYKRASLNRSYDAEDKYGSFYGLECKLTEEFLLDDSILENYSKKDIKYLGSKIVPERDLLFSYAGLHNLIDRYLIRAKDTGRSIYELPQERYMNIALAIHSKEKKIDVRNKRVLELYDALSTHKITMATPTYTNAGRPGGQLSSCFILTTEDDLRGIYDDNTDAATLSKNGGGIGRL